jgi:hypothetical protein
MFLQDTGSQSEGKSIKGAFEEFKGQFKGLSDQLAQFDVQAKKVVGDTFGQGSNYANKIRISIAEAVKETANLGYTTSDYAQMLIQISTSLQRNVDLSSTQLENMVLFADAAGISAEQVGKLVAGFEDIGFGAEGALKEMDGMAKTARSYGVNVSQYMGVIAENIGLMNKYKFKDGVDGLANMVAKAQALRINVNTVAQLAEKFLDPAGAIDAAASLQMMGGAFSSLADPFQLMNMAQNDIDGLFDSITEAAGASASFNEETGQFELSALEMRRLRGVAKELGMEYDQLAKGSLNFAARQEKLSQLEFFDFSLTDNLEEKDREFLASVGQLDKGGELKFAVKRGEETELVSATELTKSEIEKLRKQQIDDGKSNKDIALDQRDILQNLYNLATETGLKVTAESAGAIANDDGFVTFSKNLQKLGNSFSAATDSVIDSDYLKTASDTLFNSIDTAVTATLTTLNSGLTSLFDKFFKVDALGNDLVSMPGYGDRVLSGPEGSIALNNKDTVVAGTDLFGDSQDRNTEQVVADAFKGVFSKSNMEVSSERNFNQLMSNLPKDLSQALSNNMGPVQSPAISVEDLQVVHSGTIRLEGGNTSFDFDMLQKDPRLLSNLTDSIITEIGKRGLSYS